MEKEKNNELYKLSKPIIEFLEQNYNPYCSVVIDRDGVKISQIILFSPIE